MMPSLPVLLRWMLLLEGEMQAAPGSGASEPPGRRCARVYGQVWAKLRLHRWRRGCTCKVCSVPAHCASMPCTPAALAHVG